jgi:hypothetical protein
MKAVFAARVTEENEDDADDTDVTSYLTLCCSLSVPATKTPSSTSPSQEPTLQVVLTVDENHSGLCKQPVHVPITPQASSRFASFLPGFGEGKSSRGGRLNNASPRIFVGNLPNVLFLCNMVATSSNGYFRVDGRTYAFTVGCLPFFSDVASIAEEIDESTGLTRPLQDSSDSAKISVGQTKGGQSHTDDINVNYTSHRSSHLDIQDTKFCLILDSSVLSVVVNILEKLSWWDEGNMLAFETVSQVRRCCRGIALSCRRVCLLWCC